LPAELSPEERRRLAVDFAREIVDRHGLAADVAIHAPGKGGDSQNHHAHILCSTRKLTPEGFTKKTRELDDRKTGEIERWRERFGELQNERLAENGIQERVDHRSLEAQGIDREPTQHLGVAATGYERRTGEPSRKRQDFEREAADRLKAKEPSRMESEAQELESSIAALSGDIAKAKVEPEQTRPETEPKKAQVNRLFAQAVAAKTEKRPVEAVLAKTEPTVPAKPELSPVELAEQVKNGFFEEAKEAWREKFVTTTAKMAAERTAQYWEYRKEEPKEPLLFGKKQWEREHGFWVEKVNGKKAEVDSLNRSAKDAKDGKFDNDQNNIWEWSKQAQARLERERPELAKAVTAQKLAEQQKAKEARAADQAISAFKTLAVKREGKFLGYRDGGKKWEALDPGLKESVEMYNKQPQAGRGVFLDRMRENMKRDPEATEKLMERVNRGKDHDRGMER
jgi:hypothetical protein